jgi:type IV pilus assembly protein PilY1
MIRSTSTKRVFAAFMASSIMAVDVHAAVTDIYNQPLASSSAVAAKPNILFILDNSGSMERAYMPDEMSNTGKYGYWSVQCNGVAFDPGYNYVAPVKADGTSYPDALFTAALADGHNGWGTGTVRNSLTTHSFTTGSKLFTLDGGDSSAYAVDDAVVMTSKSDPSLRMFGSVTAWDSSPNDLTINVTTVQGSGSASDWYVSKTNSLNNSTYYSYTPYTGGPAAMDWTYTSSGVITSTTFYSECMSNIGSSPGSSRFSLQTVTTASSATVQQNYANWYAYYRTRRLMMRTAAGRAFQGLNNNFRVGFTTISDTTATEGTNRFVDVADYGTTQKAKFYKSLYEADGSSSTPLRGALAKAGRYFANKAPGQTVDPMQYSCQRNYGILSTDGYWNTGSETASYGPDQLTTNSDIGQSDGTEARPMNDGATTTVTTTTTSITTTQQQVDAVTLTATTYTRYIWTIAATTSTCGGFSGRYVMSIQRQDRTATAETTSSIVQDVVTTTTDSVTKDAGTGAIISDPPATTNTTTTTVSSTSSPGASGAGTFTNVGSAVAGCATSTGLSNEGLSAGSTVYSTTSDTLCNGFGCNYNATSSGSSTGGAVSGTNTTYLSGPTTTVLSGPTTATSSVDTTSSTGGYSNTLADVANYYYTSDLRTSALSNCTGALGTDVCNNTTLQPLPPLDMATHQHMTTYTIGLGVNGTLPYDSDYLNQTSGAYANIKNGSANWPDPISSSGAVRIDDLWHAAVNGRGRYFATNNATTLSNALLGALSDANKVVGSAAGAATNSLEPIVGENNRAYIATYKTVEWTGDIKAYPLDATTGAIDTTTAVWSAQTQLEALSVGSRSIKYRHPTTGALRDFTYSNLNTDGYGANFANFCSKTPVPVQCGTLSPTQITTANTGANLVNFLRGDDQYEATTNTTDPLYREREARLGDVINASPIYVKKTPLSYSDTGHASYVASTASRQAMLYAAANDGMLHAFNADTGNEVWAYVPSFVMPNLYKLADTGYKDNHTYFVDGTPVVGDVYNGTSWKTIMVGGLNSGGRGYYALDITDPANPVSLWEFTHANMGLTYGNPIITKQADGTWIVALTSGLNNTAGDGGGHLFIVNAMTGALLRTVSTGAGSVGTPSGLLKINAWIDSTADNTAKRFYGGDLLGNLWRFDHDDRILPSGNEAVALATFQHSSTSPQPITTKPQLTELTLSSGSKVPVVVVGTGRYLGLTDVPDTTVQSIYAIKDPLATTGYGDVRTRSDLVTQTVTVSSGVGTSTNNTVDWLTKIGWKIDLPLSKERIVTDLLLNYNVIVAASAITGANECQPSGGSSYLYFINAYTGSGLNGSDGNGGTFISQYLGAFLVVGASAIRTADGKTTIELVGSDASVHSKKQPSVNDPKNVRRSAWRELIN